MTPTATHPEVARLLARSRRLGADRRNTNYAGGNTSCKLRDRDPVGGEPVELLWVKGSGGDLGTLTESGLALLRRDRLLGLVGSYPGVEREDEMVPLIDYCRHGGGGAPPSIDTMMHALVDAAHVDHLHPDAGLAFATAADGEALTRACFGDRVAWLPWRRPGFQLGLDVAAAHRANPRSMGVLLGGHGITAWGATSRECEANSLAIIRACQRFVDEHGRADPFGPPLRGYEPLPEAERRARAAALLPLARGLASTDRRVVGHFRDDPIVLDFLARAEHPRLAALGTSCPDHLIRTRARPLLLDLPASAPLAEAAARLRELHAAYRDDYQAWYRRHATPATPPLRGADPAVVLVPGVGMLSFGRDAQTARLAGEFYVSALHAIRGAEALSAYRPVPDAERFRVEYWELEEAKLRRLPEPRPLAARIAVVTGGGSGIGRATARRLAAEGACVVVADLDAEAAGKVAGEIAGDAGAVEPADVAVPAQVDVADEEAVRAALELAVLAFGGVDLVVNSAGLSVSRPLLETSVEDWQRQHDVMARGSFLVAREAARVMIAQGLGGDVVAIVSKNAVAASPESIAYSAAKAAQAHQVRLLAAELGPHGIRVNGVNPDGVVRDSGIFASGWAAERARVHGVAPERLGEFYARRTLLGREVLPEHVAAAVLALTAGDLPLTTGLLVPVDGGVPAAFLR